MADGTHIEWTDATWNIITGCSVVSAGCKHCYAMKLAGTRLQHDPSRAGLTIETKAGPVWNGQVRFNERWLDLPLRWKRPRRIFVCAHGDLFHEAVPDAWIARVFAIMAAAPQHAFQVLTKRPERMRDWFELVGDLDAAQGRLHESLKGIMGYENPARPAINLTTWPLPNVWLGVSVEDQAAAGERIPYLLTTPAAVRWISAEPLLGPLDLSNVWPDGTATMNALTGDASHLLGMRERAASLDWVVAGGESGPGARPMHPAWARSLRDQCAAACVPFLF
jgi:protein gp37